jgi:hypothetical protein
MEEKAREIARLVDDPDHVGQSQSDRALPGLLIRFFFRSAFAIQNAVPAYDVIPLHVPRGTHRLMWQMC